jgi:hypothetical protein
MAFTHDLLGRRGNVKNWRFSLRLFVLMGAFAALGLGCGGNSTNRQFAKRLDELGFFKYMDPGEASKLKLEIAKTGWDGIFDETGRLFLADAESLAEWGVGSYLEELRPFLEEQGVKLESIKERYEKNQYRIIVNGKEYLIYSSEEIEMDMSGKQLGLTWGLATARCYVIINELLIEAGSDERIYAVNGGHDLFGFFLTEEQYHLICQHPDAYLPDGPYVPTEEYPHHGCPVRSTTR